MEQRKWENFGKEEPFDVIKWKKERRVFFNLK